MANFDLSIILASSSESIIKLHGISPEDISGKSSIGNVDNSKFDCPHDSSNFSLSFVAISNDEPSGSFLTIS